MTDSLNDLLLRIEKKLKSRDIRRTDLRFAPILERLPSAYPTLLSATAGLRLLGEGAISPGVCECLQEMDTRISQVVLSRLEQDLPQSVRGAFASDQEVEILALRMGWTDGCMRTREDVAEMFSTTVERVQQCESQARSTIEERGLFSPKMLHAMRELEDAAPNNDKQATALLQRLGITWAFWQGRTLLATAALLGVRHSLNLMSIGKDEYVTKLTDSAYPEKVISYARQATARGRRATLAEVASALSAEISQPLKNRDIRIVVATLDGVKFHGNERDSFSFRS